MRRIVTVAAAVAVLAMAGVKTEAAAVKTKFVQNLAVALTIWSDGDLTPVKLSTKDVIQALNGLTNEVDGATNIFHFGKGAQLLLVTTLATSNTVIVVREVSKGVKTDTDVSKYFDHSNGPTVSVTKSFVKTKRGIQEFEFEGNGKGFQVGGFTVETRALLAANGDEVTKSLQASVAGTAHSDGETSVAVGTVQVGGGRLE